jgi:nucleoside-diphosphate-sugar epimerase
MITGGSGFIGTNLVDRYLRAGFQVTNFDLSPPRNKSHLAVWQKGDLVNKAALVSAFAAAQPHLVLHAAARTDLRGLQLSDYAANTVGVRNVLEVCGANPNVRRLVAFSSMLVCRLGYRSRTDEDYCPDTIYGASKVEGEKILRTLSKPMFTWLIVRPTSIWGPWFGAPYRQFFELVERGLYFHPSGVKSVRNYGYIGNTVAQICALASAPDDIVDRKVFYVGDYQLLDVETWAKCIAEESRRQPSVRYVSPYFLRLAARLGEFVRFFGWRNFPITKSRLKNLLTDSPVDLSATQAICPNLPYALRDGVAETLAWLHDHQRSLDSRSGLKSRAAI